MSGAKFDDGHALRGPEKSTKCPIAYNLNLWSDQSETLFCQEYTKYESGHTFREDGEGTKEPKEKSSESEGTERKESLVKRVAEAIEHGAEAFEHGWEVGEQSNVSSQLNDCQQLLLGTREIRRREGVPGGGRAEWH